MKRYICARCNEASEKPHMHPEDTKTHTFLNDDAFLQSEAKRVIEERKREGLEGLVGGLEAVVINTERDRQEKVVKELIRYTSLDIKQAFEDERDKYFILSTENSADFIIKSRKQGENPFVQYNKYPKAAHLPDTRLETLIFKTNDLKKYVEIQKRRGVYFLTEDVKNTGKCLFIQTAPSTLTGNSIGFIQWLENGRDYSTKDSVKVNYNLQKPKSEHLKNIGVLDHVATRVKAKDRDAAVIEFMKLTNYKFEFAIYIDSLNSITNVTRVTPDDFALVFTSGIAPSIDEEYAGPTEQYIKNYGTRVHHMAFRTENIEHTFNELRKDGMTFLIDLVGSPGEGLRQTFSEGSKNTLLVNEYIHRYGDFDGFFTKSNVSMLTESTKKQ